MSKDEIKREEVKEMRENIKEETYSRNELISFAKEVFNVNPEVVAGALSGIPKKEFSISEVKKYINDFLKRRVK